MSVVGRVTLTDGFEVAETGEQTLELSGVEAYPGALTRAEAVARHIDILGLRGSVVQVQLVPKSERNGYATVTSSSATLRDYGGESGIVEWKLSLLRHGADSIIDLESRLTGAVRANDFSLAGERWHAPPPGHYGYFTGSTIPSTMTRTGVDGVMTVYRGVPAGVSPRWGCAVADYQRGRARILAGFPGREVTGLDQQVPASQWEIGNGLVRASFLFTAGSLEVASYTGGAWRPKVWNVDIGAGPITSWDSASILRNDPEACSLRLTDSRSPGRVALDLTVRRGSRLIEGYLQRGDSGTISVYLATAETMTNNTSYLVRSTDDANSNRATCGSARTFTAHANGGLTKTSVTAMDFYLGVVAGGAAAVSGDQATNLRDQYIAAMPETTGAVRR
ncbi:hypothetical protein Ssi03_62760 [Sphaerisporangium siamense]|uniref:Uncharacterized protein n=1 Tax=Sphaerisporangium siamense TaxID=795645 RepID=A0A7W7D960_9ACTN|nr:hypothetical protein [Sphaerisporangium siamense]MBB4702584.1 hypothetical protein [Sphaerisporangium siamense]GII88286.1 hypothetical protein Ssi03_62760 [Sphaerisporangium siamense]